MLYPQTNALRRCVLLDGFWDFRPDPESVGAGQGWMAGFDGGRPIAVPGSWNEQLDDVRHYLGDAWYQTSFYPPFDLADLRAEGQRAILRFSSVVYLADVWLNGDSLGQHEGGHLPFEFDVTDALAEGSNRLVVRVNGEPRRDRLPPGGFNVDRDPLDSFTHDTYPDTNFDFYPYSGIHRPVLLYTVPAQAIRDVTVTTAIEGSAGVVRVRVESSGGPAHRIRLTLDGYGNPVQAEGAFSNEQADAILRVPDARLWSPQMPDLYDLTVELVEGDAVRDSYTLTVGIRTIAVDGDRLLLNGQPVKLRGFGRHEDFPVVGRGYLPALIVRDYELMRWVGANSFRTTHYPYSEQMLDLADRLGFLVIDETPAVGMTFHPDGLEGRMRVWRQATREMIARDKNHPSVILWSLANEPHARRPEARAAFEEIFALARGLDPTRPLTAATYLGLEDLALPLCDVIALNRYRAWYSEAGQIEAGALALEAELEAIHAAYPRPLILSEFGADTVAGLHAQPPVMFSEEYQADLIEVVVRLVERKPYVVGQHVWNLCDFATSQEIRRIGAMNLKGVFTRDRRPKLAAHRLRELWRGQA